MTGGRPAETLENKVGHTEEKTEIIRSTCWYLPGKIGEIDTDFLVDSGT